jgi:hypothetical protein
MSEVPPQTTEFKARVQGRIITLDLLLGYYNKQGTWKLKLPPPHSLKSKWVLNLAKTRHFEC